MTLIDRDQQLEVDVLQRVARVAQEPSFPTAVQHRLDDVETAGGPDGGGVTSAAQAFGEARAEYIDGPAWTIIGLNRLVSEIEHGQLALDGAVEACFLVEEAMTHAAHAAHLMQGAVDLLTPATSPVLGGHG